jgi:hypothetical protein
MKSGKKDEKFNSRGKINIDRKKLNVRRDD